MVTSATDVDAIDAYAHFVMLRMPICRRRFTLAFAIDAAFACFAIFFFFSPFTPLMPYAFRFLMLSFTPLRLR